MGKGLASTLSSWRSNLGAFLWRQERHRVPLCIAVKLGLSRKPDSCSSLYKAPLSSIPGSSAGNLCSAPGETPSDQTPVVQRRRGWDLTADAEKQARPKLAAGQSLWSLVRQAPRCPCCVHRGPHIQQAQPGSHSGRSQPHRWVDERTLSLRCSGKGKSWRAWQCCGGRWRVPASRAVTTLLEAHIEPYQKKNHLSYWEGPSAKYTREKSGWSKESLGELGGGTWHRGGGNTWWKRQDEKDVVGTHAEV